MGNLIPLLPFYRAEVYSVTLSLPVSVRVCVWNKCMMEPEQGTQLLWPQTKWILGLLGGIFVLGCKRGASDTSWGTPCATAIFCWEKKKGLLRADRKYCSLDQQNQKWGDFICPWGHLCLALLEDALVPLIQQPAGRAHELLPQLRLICPPAWNLGQMQIPLSSPFLLIIAVYLRICRAFI